MSQMKNFLCRVQEYLEAGYSIEQIMVKEPNLPLEMIEQAIEFWTDYAE
jgi:uncharacterized protein (DUF433 family)